MNHEDEGPALQLAGTPRHLPIPATPRLGTPANVYRVCAGEAISASRRTRFLLGEIRPFTAEFGLLFGRMSQPVFVVDEWGLACIAAGCSPDRSWERAR